jgi:tetratricopeptide (TPR) repeat protein
MFAPTAGAADAPVCHDMPERQSVLEEGKRLLRDRGEYGHYESGRFQHSEGIRFFPADTRHFELDEPASSPSYSDMLHNYTLRYDASEPAPLELAQLGENFRQTADANTLYMSLLKADKQKTMSDVQKAATMEGAARTTLMLRSKYQFRESVDLTEVRNFEEAPKPPEELFFSRFKLVRRYVVLDAIAQSPSTISEKEWNFIESLYTQALAIRTGIGDKNEPLISDLLILGALNERKKNLNEALSYYLRAAQVDEKTSADLANFLSRNNTFDVPKGLRSEVLTLLNKSHDSKALSALIQDKANNDGFPSAVGLFKLTADSHIILTADALLVVLNSATVSDLPAMELYLEHVWVDSPEFETRFNSVMLAMTKRGWTDQANSICDEIMHQNSSERAIRPSLIIASWYVQSNNFERSIKAYQNTLNTINEKHYSAEQSLENLAQLKSIIAKDSNRSQEYDSIKKAVERSTKFYEDQIRRRQCLEMAKQLNETAFNLEKRTHFDMARKLYQQALEIKQLNLAPNDPETAKQIIDLARVATEQNKYVEAQRLYEKALSTLRKNPLTDASDTIAALESYGQMLNDSKQAPKANQIYNEARMMAGKTHH